MLREIANNYYTWRYQTVKTYLFIENCRLLTAYKDGRVLRIDEIIFPLRGVLVSKRAAPLKTEAISNFYNISTPAKQPHSFRL